MKRIAGFASMLVLLAAPAFASGSKKPQTVVIPQNMQVGSTQVAAGTYKLAWTGDGAEVQATLTLSGKTVTTFAAKAVDEKNANPGVDTAANGGVVTLRTIHLDKVSLQLEGAPHSGQ